MIVAARDMNVFDKNVATRAVRTSMNGRPKQELGRSVAFADTTKLGGQTKDLLNIDAIDIWGVKRRSDGNVMYMNIVGKNRVKSPKW
jgi:hypothetical protein